MAWTRAYTTHAEASDLEVLFMPDSILYTRPIRSSSEALTGTYSWRFASRSGPIILPLSGAVAMRTSIGHQMDSLLLDGDVNVFTVYQENSTNPAVEVRLMEHENEVRLYTDGILRMSAIMVDSLIADYWVHLKLVVDSVAGFASVYREMPAPTNPSLAARILTSTA